MSVFDPQPVTLTGDHVALVPLAPAHAGDLCRAGSDPRIWPYISCDPLTTVARAETYIAGALDAARDGSEVPFAIVHRAGGAAVGSTRYLAIRRPHRSLEIGWTWLGPDHWRTPVNTECKLLLLTHAFETHGALRVEFKTDARNQRSQNALARIGAQREGVLRQHILMPDGHRRDSVYYSIIDREWPAVQAALRAKLRTPGP